MDAVIALEAADTFALGSNWIPQNTTATISQEHTEMIKANGDTVKFSSVFNVLTSVTTTYAWNALTGLGAAFPKVGEVKNAYLITEISGSSNYNTYPEIVITGHQHAENPHVANNEFSVPALIQTAFTGAHGAYDIYAKASAVACALESNFSLTANHIDQDCDTGNHFVGQTINGLVTASVTYSGIVDTPLVVAGWVVTSVEPGNDSNAAFDISTINAEQFVLRD